MGSGNARTAEVRGLPVRLRVDGNPRHVAVCGSAGLERQLDEDCTECSGGRFELCI